MSVTAGGQAAPPDTSTPWRRNLYAIFVSQLIVMMGFSFVSPFMPLFIQELGGYSNQDAAFWAGLAVAAGSIAMFIAGPLWGILADRWGRKPMVLRAMFGTGFLLALTGFAPNVPVTIALRFSQGLLSGTMAAASALAASCVPRDKVPFAMSLVMAAMFGGNTAGPLLGGILADAFGYKATFLLTGAVVSAGGLIVILVVRENFTRPAQPQPISFAGPLRIAMSRQMLPYLMAVCALHVGPQMISPIISLFVRELDPAGPAATASGLAFCVMGVVAALSSFVAGRLAKRFDMRTMLVVSCIGAGLLYLPPMLSTTVAQLILFMAITGLLKGGLMVSSNALVGLGMPLAQQGIAYGLVQSAGALGSGIGPILGGSLAPFVGFRPIFAAAAAIFLLTAIAIVYLLRRARTAGALVAPAKADP